MDEVLRVSIPSDSHVTSRGFAIVSEVLSESELEELRSSFENAGVSGRSPNTIAPHAIRNLLASNSAVRSLSTRVNILNMVRAILGNNARPVKATYFDKTPNANWKVPPHQDVTITVQERIDTPGFGPWTEKDGVQNVQPPVAILEQILALRFHLDDCHEDNGALKVWPGSHTTGRLKDAGISEWLSRNEPQICPVPSGGVMLMRPLLLHASSPAVNPSHRRVIHIEYAACDLPNGLKWQTEVSDV